jgi:hypothetical protein
VDVKTWLCLRAFGVPNPDWDNDVPDDARASALKKAKSAISIFMPNQHVAWINGHSGNLTQHPQVTKVIQDVQNLQTKGIGAKPNDKRPYHDLEFVKLLEILWNQTDFINRWKFVMATLWAYHLIHQVDNTAHLNLLIPMAAP